MIRMLSGEVTVGLSGGLDPFFLDIVCQTGITLGLSGRLVSPIPTSAVSPGHSEGVLSCPLAANSFGFASFLYTDV